MLLSKHLVSWMLQLGLYETKRNTYDTVKTRDSYMIEGLT